MKLIHLLPTQRKKRKGDFLNVLGSGIILSQSNIRLGFMFVVFDLSPEAIASLNKLAEESGLTRSEFIEHSIALLEAANSALPVRPVFHKKANKAQLTKDMRRTTSRYLT